MTNDYTVEESTLPGRSADYPRMKLSTSINHGNIEVSTVRLPSPYPDGEYETLIFGYKDGEYLRRYKTEEAARIGHKLIVERWLSGRI